MSKNGCIRAKVVVFGQSGCVLEKAAVFEKKWLYSGKSGCIRAVIRQNGCIRAVVVVFGQKCVFSGKVVLFG